MNVTWAAAVTVTAVVVVVVVAAVGVAVDLLLLPCVVVQSFHVFFLGAIPQAVGGAWPNKNAIDRRPRKYVCIGALVERQ